MENEDRKSQPWTGEEVEDAPPGQAERAAERAEGNAPVPAGRADRDHDLSEEPEDDRRRAPSGLTADEKEAEAAEDHREREREGDRPPHGKL